MFATSKAVLLFCLAFSHAQPRHQRSITLIDLSKRALPQWINFTPNGPSNPKIASITQAFKDMTTLINIVKDPASSDTYKTVFSNYFPDDNMQDAVKQVLTNMVKSATTDPETGADKLSSFVIDAIDHYNLDQYHVAYTTNPEDENDSVRIHFSDTAQRNAYAYPLSSWINCDTLGAVVSDKMLSMG
ncbi:hypothetical protein MMC21_007455 [Puttea exsequens]|nr:hypothetical protein [Puttea exsequens]